MTLNPGLSSSAPALPWQKRRPWRSAVAFVVAAAFFAVLFSVVLMSRAASHNGTPNPFFATWGVPLGIVIGLSGPVAFSLSMRNLYGPRVALARSLRSKRPAAVVVTLRATTAGTAVFRTLGAVPAQDVTSLKSAPPPPSVLVVERGRMSFWSATANAPVNALEVPAKHVSFLRLRDEAIANGSPITLSRANASWVFAGIRTDTGEIVELPLSMSREGLDAPWPLTGADLRDCVATLSSLVRG